MSTSLATLLADLIHEYGIGYAGTMTSNGTTTTIIDANRFSGPLPGGLVPNGSPIRVTSGSAIDDHTYKSNIDPSTGTITVSPAITAPASGDTFVLATGVNHMDRLVEAINRALQRRCSRWLKVPLTAVPDGDFLGGLLGGAVSDHWAISASDTQAYVDLTMAEGWAETALRVTAATGTTATSTSDNIGVEVGEQREGLIFMRSQTSADTASFVIHDVTNNATITPTFQYGTGSTTSQAFVCQRYSYVVPAGCTQVNYQLSITGTNADWAEFACVVDAGDNQRMFGMQPHLRSSDDIGSWQRAVLGPTSTSGPADVSFQPISDDGVGIQEFGWGLGVEWDFIPQFPTFYEEYCFFPALSASTDTTNCTEELVICGAAIELFSMLIRQSGEKPTFYRGKVLPTATMLKLQSAQELWMSPRVARLRAPRRVDIKRTYGRQVFA